MLLTMEDRSPPELNFVLTNVINDEPGDVAVFKRILRMVAARSATFVPVVLDCATDEHLKRIPTPERAARFKWTASDVEVACEYVINGQGADLE